MVGLNTGGTSVGTSVAGAGASVATAGVGGEPLAPFAGSTTRHLQDE
jgi:hypothetical protein